MNMAGFRSPKARIFPEHHGATKRQIDSRPVCAPRTVESDPDGIFRRGRQGDTAVRIGRVCLPSQDRGSVVGITNEIVNDI